MTAEGHPVARRRALRAIALFEGIKGVAALAVTLGFVDLMHHDARHLAVELIGRFHFRAESHYQSLLMHYADLLPGANVSGIVLLATIYILVRLLEAYGLWMDRTWGEVLGALSGGIYVPFEFVHFMHRHTFINAAVLAGNLFVVGFLAVQLWRRRRAAVAAKVASCAGAAP